MSLNHVIKLLINLFVFLLSARGEDEGGRFELWALAAFVLLLAQSLPGPTTRERRRDGGRHRDGWTRTRTVGAEGGNKEDKDE